RARQDPPGGDGQAQRGPPRPGHDHRRRAGAGAAPRAAARAAGADPQAEAGAGRDRARPSEEGVSESNRTLAYVGVSGVLFLLAFVVPSASSTPAEFSDQGERFFPAFTDSTQATSLEVWEADEPVPFKVELKDGVWRI